MSYHLKNFGPVIKIGDYEFNTSKPAKDINRAGSFIAFSIGSFFLVYLSIQVVTLVMAYSEVTLVWGIFAVGAFFWPLYQYIWDIQEELARLRQVEHHLINAIKLIADKSDSQQT
jgi:hypothetical protein